MRVKPNLAADAALIATTLIWGSTFVIAKDILTHWPPLAYLAFRFGIATLALVALFPRHIARARRREWTSGAVLAALISVGFALQAAGQVYTTPSKSAFITGLTTPLVPFVAFLILGARPSIENLVGVALASLGGALILAPRGAEPVNMGDLLTLASTLLFAMHITLMSLYTRRVRTEQLTALQILIATVIFVAIWFVINLYAATTTGAASLPVVLARETAPLMWNAGLMAQLLYLALVGTVVTFLLWTWGQARMSATHAAIIFSLEPIFATAFAVALRGQGELMGGMGWLGAVFVLGGVVISEIRWGGRDRGAERVRRGNSEEI